jgi:trans-aconitate methyltransferase
VGTLALTQITDAWEQSDAYEEYVGRWSRQVAPAFLSWLGISTRRRWLDVGCGTGALCAAILDRFSPAFVAGVEPSEPFLEKAKEHLADRVALCRGTAAQIPLVGESVEVTVSGLVLNFVPDGRSALREMARVTVKGGAVGAYVWDYAGKMELMRFFWDSAIALNPDAAKLDQGVRFPLCRPEALTELFESAGLCQVTVTAVDIKTPFASFEDYWHPFLRGQGPAPAYAMALDKAARARLSERIRERIPRQADGSISLIARAWAVRAVVAR